MKATGNWLSAADAARRLGVKRATLYAYVSRGLVRSSAKAGPTRERMYARDDIERLRRRSEERRDPQVVATHALDLGTPVLQSAITLIDRGRLYYRGHDAVELATTRAVAEVAALIWTGEFEEVEPKRVPMATWPARSGDTPFIARAQSLLALTAACDATGFDLRGEAVARAGAHILNVMASAATGVRVAPGPIDERLASAWRLHRGAAELLRAAIILCADHELNVSAFTARCVASAYATPYSAVIAALSALEGVRHGGMTSRVDAMLTSMHRTRTGRAAVGERLRQGEEIYGFGHPLYPEGDPRAKALLAMLRRHAPHARELRFALDISSAATAALDSHPTIDFALAVVSRALGLPSGAGLILFAIGRTIGWIGHSIEQYVTGQLIRPRARYVGAIPAR